MSERQLELFDWSPSPCAQCLEEAPSGALTVLRFPVVKRRPNLCVPEATMQATIASFPQDRRYSKVMDVASKLQAKTTSRAVEYYRWQVAAAMSAHLRTRHVPANLHRELIRRFWVAVDCEVARRVNGRQRPGGAA